MTKKSRQNFWRMKRNFLIFFGKSWVSSGKVDFFNNFSQMYRNLTLGFLGFFHWPFLGFFYFFRVATLSSNLRLPPWASILGVGGRTPQSFGWGSWGVAEWVVGGSSWAVREILFYLIMYRKYIRKW